MAFDTNSQAKTLADMTAEERWECTGMWADVVGFTRPTPIVQVWGEEVELLVCNNLRGHITETYEFAEVTPRFDLPRAWTPDGEPVQVKKEYGNGGWDEETNSPYHWPIGSAACDEDCALFDKESVEYSRWVSNWEQVKPEPRRVNGMVNEHV